MPDDADFLSNARSAQGAFQTTRWSLVVNARAEDHPEALAQLCRDYWYPLYAFLRRRGLPMHDAQDVTQAFFLHLLDGPLLERADPRKGRFRSFLLGALQNFLANERRRANTQKCGDGIAPLSMDAALAEQRFALESADQDTPERHFERSWALTLLECVFARLGADYERAGHAEIFARLRPYLSGKAGMPGYAALAREMAMSESAVAVAVHRMRRRYGELLREEIAHTVAEPGEVEEEIAHLLQVVARS